MQIIDYKRLQSQEKKIKNDRHFSAPIEPKILGWQRRIVENSLFIPRQVGSFHTLLAYSLTGYRPILSMNNKYVAI